MSGDWPGPPSVQAEAVASALGLPPSLVALEPLAPASWRRSPWRARRSTVLVAGEARHSVRWFESGHPRPFPELAGAAAAFSRATGLRTPRFIARAVLPGANGLVEEFVGGAVGLDRVRAAGSPEEKARANERLAACHSVMHAAPACPEPGVAARDLGRCLAALHWLGPTCPTGRRLRDWLQGPDAPFAPAPRLLHEDLLACNVLLQAGNPRPVVVDFEHCQASVMPWYAAWRIAYFDCPFTPAVPGFAQVLADVRLPLLCLLLETERQFSVLERPRFLHDWNRGWLPALRQACQNDTAALSALDSAAPSFDSVP